MSRPRKYTDPRSQTVVFEAHELEAVRAAALANWMPVSEWIRVAAVAALPAQPVPAPDPRQAALPLEPVVCLPVEPEPELPEAAILQFAARRHPLPLDVA